MNKLARRELPELIEEIANFIVRVERDGPLSAWASKQLYEVDRLIEMLRNLEIGIELVLNELQYSLETLAGYCEPNVFQSSLIQKAIGEISDFVDSPRYR